LAARITEELRRLSFEGLESTACSLGDVGALANASAAEEANLAARPVWCEQVENFDAGFEDSELGAEVDDRSRLPVQRLRGSKKRRRRSFRRSNREAA
jgi:hypothetical protein